MNRYPYRNDYRSDDRHDDRNDDRNENVAVEPRPETRPVFMVNPSITIVLNDNMAEDLVAYLRKTSLSHTVPSHVYAFMRQLENDLMNARAEE